MHQHLGPQEHLVPGAERFKIGELGCEAPMWQLKRKPHLQLNGS